MRSGDTHMTGYILTFFTQQNREHNGQPVAAWIVATARQLGIRGATLLSGMEGFGHDGQFHSDNFFDFADRPQQVVLVVTADESDRLFARITTAGLKIFFTKTPTEFGSTLDT